MISVIKTKYRLFFFLLLIVFSNITAGIEKGDKIPPFNIPTGSGTSVSNTDLSGQNLSILYFFTTTCKPCLEGLLQLQAMIEKYKDHRLKVLGIAKQSAGELEQFAGKQKLLFTMLSANENMLREFRAAYVFPTTYIVGRDLTVLNVLQGGGASAQHILADIAERQLQINNPGLAEKIYRDAITQGDTSAKTQAGVGYALLKQGAADSAVDVFAALAKSKDPQTAVKGMEGLAEGMLQQGKPIEAEKALESILKVAPERAPARLIKGKLLYRQGNKVAADREVQLATSSNAKSDYDWQRAEVQYAMGNLQRQNKQYKKALASYQQASKHNPYLAGALSNQGVALQEMGEPEKALEIFKQVKHSHPNDKLAASLIRQAKLAIEEKRDFAKQKRIDAIVKELIDRRRTKTGQEQKPVDDWTTPPIAVSILGFSGQDQGALMERAGLGSVLTEELTSQLQSANVSVVDRAILDKVLKELKLGSSELADPDTALELGRILAARLITTGNIYRTGKDTRISLRMIDTETTDIILPLAETANDPDPTAISARFAKTVADSIDSRYPLKGRIALVEDDSIVINLGRKHHIIPGMVFNVLGNEKPIELNGKILGYKKTNVGRLVIQDVDELMAYASVQEKTAEWHKNQKIILKEQ